MCLRLPAAMKAQACCTAPTVWVLQELAGVRALVLRRRDSDIWLGAGEAFRSAGHSSMIWGRARHMALRGTRASRWHGRLRTRWP